MTINFDDMLKEMKDDNRPSWVGEDKESPRKKQISSQPRMTCLCAVTLEKCFVHTCIVTLSHLDGGWGQCSPCLQLTDMHENKNVLR